MFEGFTLDHIDTGEAILRVAMAASVRPYCSCTGIHARTPPGTALLRCSPAIIPWYAPTCAATVHPPSRRQLPDHAPYSKRAMARDCLALMRALGYERFAVAGHDRGSYVAFRLAMDHPAAVSHLAVLDSVPIGEALARCNATFARRWWHWFFLGQTQKPAERVICADPDAWYQGNRDQMGAEAWEDYQRAIHDPATVRAMCEDYRAGLGIDRAHDDDDRLRGRRISCPTLVLWAAQDDMEDLYGDVLGIWQSWSDDVRGHALDCGHHMAEERPEVLAADLHAFLSTPV